MNSGRENDLFTRVTETEAMYERPRVNVKVERRSASTLKR